MIDSMHRNYTGLEAHPYAQSITRSFFAQLGHNRTENEIHHFFQEFRAILKFMSLEDLIHLRKVITTPAELSLIEQEFQFRINH